MCMPPSLYHYFPLDVTLGESSNELFSALSGLNFMAEFECLEFEEI